MKTLSMDLRERIVDALIAGGSVQEVATRFCVSHDSVRRLQLKHERGESLAPSPRLGRQSRVSGQEESLVLLVKHNPSATIEEIRGLWQQQSGVLLPHSTMHDALVRVRARFKKTPVARERNEAARCLFREQIELVAADKLVFLDECGFASNMRRLYGWAIRGERCVEVASHTRAKNRSCLGAFSLPTASNPTGLWKLWQKLGAWNSLLFEAFVVDELLPLLPPKSVLVLDNARIHQSQTLKESVEEAGHQLLFLPPYSPDFNPIELVWGWLKHQVRRLMPEGDEQREAAIRQAQDVLPPQHAYGWFRKCGLTPLLSD